MYHGNRVGCCMVCLDGNMNLAITAVVLVFLITKTSWGCRPHSNCLGVFIKFRTVFAEDITFSKLNFVYGTWWVCVCVHACVHACACN